MNNLIYFSTQCVRNFDYEVMSPNFIHNKWFKLLELKLWAPHIVSRVHKLDTPWDLHGTICPIPEITNTETNFEIVMDGIAEDFCRKAEITNRTPYVCWSGGVDSASILVAILKVASPELLKKLVVLYDKNSVLENPYFFYKFIDKKIKAQDIDNFKVTTENYNKILLTDGEAGNQMMSHNAIQRLMYKQRFDLLDTPWRYSNPKDLLMNASDFHIELITESIKYAPIPIETGYDFLWWTNFNFKVDEVLLRKAIPYTAELDSVQSKEFYEESLYRFYVQPAMQIWSMLAKDIRREGLKITPKYVPKKYIHDFDKNDFYFYNKREEPSCSQNFLAFSYINPVFAIDVNWCKYSLADAETRIALGKLLQKI